MPDGLAALDAQGCVDQHIGDLDGYDGALGGMKRRDFLQYCTGVAAALGLSPALGVTIANAAAAAANRPAVIWLSGQACTGCVETLLRTSHPSLETLILSQISLEYCETLNAGSGHQAEAWKQQAMKDNWGKYIMVTDGSVPIKDGGVYCKVAGKTYREQVEECAAGAAAILTMGSCASWGGWPSTGVNPTGAVGLGDVITDKPIITIPGCPPNPYNFLSTVLHFIAFGTLPALDDKGRPKFAYGRLIHENCERRPHFDAGRFAMEFGDYGHRQGYCLFKLGCKGPETYANCPAIGFNDVGQGTWPVGTGHPCFGCTEEGVGFTKSIHELATLKSVAPPDSYPGVAAEKGAGASPGAVAAVAGIVGAAVGAGTVIASRLGKHDESGTSAGPGA
ncbi:hydrogenase small subunit [Azospirillum halopraeferens]|uniref:hydrogenase small subunit n=1 Tax=Azospirillum halopraeferens TaxID=34010 RepID=UPI0003F9FAC4|nr:hydrogenase small subunit [Azospirillum halopraeferens]